MKTLKGFVSSNESTGSRVTFPEKENVVSPPLQTFNGVTVFEIGTNVLVIFFSDNMKDGLIWTTIRQVN